MSELQDQFARAQEEVNKLLRRPENDVLLRLYALYKQATQGDALGERPTGFDLVKMAKFDAWNKLKGTSQVHAMQQYVDLVDSMRH